VTVAANAQLEQKGRSYFGLISSTPGKLFKDAYKFGLGGELYGGVGLGSNVPDWVTVE